MMAMKNYTNIFVFFVFTAVLFACQEEANDDNTKESIIGIWDLSKATRNGKVTETLNNMRMEFISKDSMFSNLQGTRERQSYYIEDGVIYPEGARLNPEYKIVTVNDTILQLKMILREVQFDLDFQRNYSE